MDSKQLSRKQRKAIPLILNGPTIERGCETAGIAKSTFYKWMDNDLFHSEVNRQIDAIADAGFVTLKQNCGRAAITLVDLLVCKDHSVRRRAACDILGFFDRHGERHGEQSEITIQYVDGRSLDDMTDEELTAQFAQSKHGRFAGVTVEELREQLRTLAGDSGGSGDNGD